MTLSIFPVVIGHLYIFFGEMSTQILCPIIGCIYPIWFLLLNCKSSLYILGINPLSDIWFENIFSHCVGCLFTLWILSVDAHCFNFDEVLMCLFFLSFFFFWVCFSIAACAFGVLLEKLMPNPMSGSFPSMFSSKFITLALTFRSWIHF